MVFFNILGIIASFIALADFFVPAAVRKDIHDFFQTNLLKARNIATPRRYGMSDFPEDGVEMLGHTIGLGISMGIGAVINGLVFKYLLIPLWIASPWFFKIPLTLPFITGACIGIYFSLVLILAVLCLVFSFLLWTPRGAMAIVALPLAIFAFYEKIFS